MYYVYAKTETGRERKEKIDEKRRVNRVACTFGIGMVVAGDGSWFWRYLPISRCSHISL